MSGCLESRGSEAVLLLNVLIVFMFYYLLSTHDVFKQLSFSNSAVYRQLSIDSFLVN